MGVKTNLIEIVPELTSQSVDFLLGSILGKRIATMEVQAEWIARAGLTANSEDMIFEADDNSIIWNGGNFEDEGFKVGDSIYIDTPTNEGVFTIQSIDNDKIITNETLSDETSETAVITGITECFAARFRYNLIENNETPSYNSKTDNNELLFFGTADRDYAVLTSLPQQGVYKSNHQGTVKIKGKLITFNDPAIFGDGDGTMTVSGKNFITMGVRVGDVITIGGSSLNDGSKTILTVEKETLTFTTTTVTEEAANITYAGGAYLNIFVIEHTFYITPFYLLAQLSDLQQLIAPDYFFNANCLTYLRNIQLLYALNDPNKLQDSGDVLEIGNTAWFNENFNGGLKKYNFNQKVNFYRISDLAALDYVDYNSPTQFEMFIVSQNSTFNASGTSIVVNHFILPEAESEYVNTATDQDTNFMYDRVFIDANDTLTQSDNNGTGKQVFKDVKFTYISTSVLYVTGTIDLSSAYKTRIAALADRRLVLSVELCDWVQSTINSDVVCLVDDTQDSEGNYNAVRQYDTDNSNPDVATIENTFDYPPEAATGMSRAGVFIEDGVLGKSIIGVDTANGALVSDVTVRVVATDGTDEFELEKKQFSFASAVITGGVQIVNFVESKGYVLGSTNPFNEVSLKRRSDLDAGDIKYYELIYAFKIRWEDFISLAGVNSDFYDVSELNNGYNNDWNRYFAASGWSLKYRVTANVIENEYSNEIEQENDVLAYTYDEAEDWSQEIKIFDIDSGLEITNSILSDKIVKVQAIFTKTSGTAPDLADVEGFIEYEPYQQGGVSIIRNINTIYEHETSSPFISVLSNKLLKKEKASNVYTFTANIDGRKLTGRPKISARIYEPPYDEYKQFEEDDFFEFEEGDVYEFED